MIKEKTRKNILLVIIVLGLIGLATSIYLTDNHYADTDKGAICDFGETVSCSLVNTSVYSELFNVPVALFGALWLVFMILMAWKSLKKDSSLTKVMLGWTIFGVLFIIYMIIAEILLGAICLFCTLVHIIVLVTFVLMIILYKGQKTKTKDKKFVKTLTPWAIGIIIINIIPLIIFNVSVGGEKINYDSLAQCITEKGVNMYGSFRCSVCARERKLFGDSFQYINEIECHPQGENPQTEMCLDKGVKGTPTWILEPNGVEVDRREGFMSIEDLKEFSGCE